jgi:hypothetical protein
MAATFAAMAREREGRMTWLRSELDKLNRLPREDRTSYSGMFWIGYRERQMDTAKREHKRFTFYANLCAGKTQAKELDTERAKEFPIGELIESKPMGKSGGRVRYLCPLHMEKTPSFVWFVEKNRFKCFGCGAGGDSIALAMKLRNIGFLEAVKRLT